MAEATIAERWMPVLGFVGRYEVSSLGRVRSLVYPEGKGGRILKPDKNNWGYMQVRLTRRRGDYAEKRTVHSVVLEAFVGPRPLGNQCNHKDGNKCNNAATNLEWVTPSENTLHSYHVLKQRIPRGSERGNTTIVESDVLEIRRLVGCGVTQTEIARRFPVSQSAVSRIASRETWNHV